MKTLTYEQIKSRMETANERDRERHEKIQAEEALLGQLKMEQENAAADGDFDTWEAKAEEIRKAEGRIVVLTKMRNPEIVTPEDMVKSWEEYASREEKELAADLAAYRKKQKAAAEDFEAMVKKANSILKRQKEYATMGGIDPNSSAGKEKMNIRFKLGALIPYNFDPNFPHGFSLLPEFEYFGRAGLWNRDADKILIDIVKNHTAVDSIKFN